MYQHETFRDYVARARAEAGNWPGGLASPEDTRPYWGGGFQAAWR